MEMEKNKEPEKHIKKNNKNNKEPGQEEKKKNLAK